MLRNEDLISCSVRSLAGNVLGLCEVADLEAQMLNFAQMYIEIPNVEFSTEAAILQNPCYLLPFFLFVILS